AARAGKSVRREDQIMNQGRAVDRVFAVITGVVMAAGDVNGPFIYKRIELRRFVREQRRALRQIARIGSPSIVRDPVPREWKGRGRRRAGGWRGVAGTMDKTRERLRVARAPRLVINSQRVGPGKPQGNSFIDPKWKER